MRRCSTVTVSDMYLNNTTTGQRTCCDRRDSPVGGVTASDVEMDLLSSVIVYCWDVSAGYEKVGSETPEITLRRFEINAM